MKIDLSKPQWLSFLKPWQVPLFLHVLGTDDKTTSSKAHKWLKGHENEDFRKSRTSVIFFLQDLEEAGWMTMEEADGKGGAHEVFQRTKDVNAVLSELDTRCTNLFRGLQGKVN